MMTLVVGIVGSRQKAVGRMRRRRSIPVFSAYCLLPTAYSLEHPRPLRVLEDAAGLDDRQHVAERAEVVAFAGGAIENVAVGQVDFQLVACADLVDEAVVAFERDEVPAVDAVAEEDAGVELGDYALDARLGQRQWGMLAARAAAEVLAADDDPVVALELVLA